MSITRCCGINTGLGYLCGDGYEGKTKPLDDAVKREAEILQRLYGRDVEIRFNHNRESGGAWLVDGQQNASLGMSAHLFTQESLNTLRKWLAEEKNPVIRRVYEHAVNSNQNRVGTISFSVLAELNNTEHDFQKSEESFVHWDFDSMEEAEKFLLEHFKGLKS